MSTVPNNDAKTKKNETTKQNKAQIQMLLRDRKHNVDSYDQEPSWISHLAKPLVY